MQETAEHPVLRREQILSAAVRLADSAGMEGVSIRKIAGHLGVGPMRIYTHVPTKADLLSLMVDHVYGEIADELVHAGTSAASWRDRVGDVCGAFRAAAFRHHWFVDLLSGRPSLDPNALMVLEITASGVESAPYRHTAASTRLALSVINAFLIGATRTDVLERELDEGDGGTAADWQRSAELHLRDVFAGGRFPTLEHLAFESVMTTPEIEFERGLAMVLDGIEDHLRRDE